MLNERRKAATILTTLVIFISSLNSTPAAQTDLHQTSEQQPKVKTIHPQPAPTEAKIIENEAVIRLKEKSLPTKKAMEEREDVLKRAGKEFSQKFAAKVIATYPWFGWIRLQLSPGDSFTSVMKGLKSDARVQYVLPNYEVTLHGHHRYPPPPNDRAWTDHFPGSYPAPYPDYSYLWGLDKISMEEAWKIRPDGLVITAVLDTGIDENHPDLSANNHGGIDICGASSTPTDFEGHGTYVASILASQGNNWVPTPTTQPESFLGVNPAAKILTVKIACPVPNIIDAISGIRYAIQNGAAVINGSWGLYGLPATHPFIIDMKDEIVAGRNTTLYVASAGNEVRNLDKCSSPTMWPQMFNLKNLIVVAATTPSDTLLVVNPRKGPNSCSPTNNDFEGSNFGKRTVHLGAPGDTIWGALLMSQFGSSGNPIENTALVTSSTSAAAPFVAGCATLLLAERRAKVPTSRIPPSQLKSLLMKWGDRRSKLANIMSSSRLNCHKALLNVP
jgi:hypothetical protein